MGFVIKLVLMALINAFGLFGILSAWAAESWGILVFLLLALIAAALHLLVEKPGRTWIRRRFDRRRDELAPAAPLACADPACGAPAHPDRRLRHELR